MCHGGRSLWGMQLLSRMFYIFCSVCLTWCAIQAPWFCIEFSQKELFIARSGFWRPLLLYSNVSPIRSINIFWYQYRTHKYLWLQLLVELTAIFFCEVLFVFCFKQLGHKVYFTWYEYCCSCSLSVSISMEYLSLFFFFQWGVSLQVKWDSCRQCMIGSFLINTLSVIFLI